jgi:hypothetical protein
MTGFWRRVELYFSFRQCFYTRRQAWRAAKAWQDRR